MLMPGQNPAAAAASHGLNVGVASYMPMYQLPQMHGATGGVGPAGPEHSADPTGGVGGGGVEGKHGAE